MLSNISVGRDVNKNALEAIQMFSAATTVNCFHKTRTVVEDKCESKADMVNWQHLCQKPDVVVPLDFIGVDAIVVQELREDDETVFEILTERNGIWQ
jgi:hypothetical protein